MTSLRQGDSRRLNLAPAHFCLNGRNRSPDDYRLRDTLRAGQMLRLLNRARARSRPLTVTGLNRRV